LALLLFVAPQFRKGGRALPMAEVSLIASRGSEFTVVPEGRPLHVVLNANDLAEKQIDVKLVDANGKGLWSGTAAVQHNRAVVDLPKIDEKGEHYVRLYGPATQGEPELLREFPIEVR
jgi:hypothetical protein